MPLSKIIEEQLKEFDNTELEQLSFFGSPYGSSYQHWCLSKDKVKAFLSASITKACEEMIYNIIDKLEREKKNIEKEIYRNAEKLNEGLAVDYQSGFLQGKFENIQQIIEILTKKQEEFFKDEI